MEIVNIKVKDLKPYENNPRINDDAVDKVAQSIKEYGFKVPIVIDKNYVVVTGHTRLKAAKKLGLKDVPCVVADDLSEKQIKAFSIADNKVSDYSIWDNKLLLIELKDLDDLFTGFDTSEIFNDVLDESKTDVLDENEEGVIYSIAFKSHNKELVERVRDFIEMECRDAFK